MLLIVHACLHQTDLEVLEHTYACIELRYSWLNVGPAIILSIVYYRHNYGMTTEGSWEISCYVVAACAQTSSCPMHVAFHRSATRLSQTGRVTFVEADRWLRKFLRDRKRLRAS